MLGVALCLLLAADQGQVRPAGRLLTPRSGHTATALLDGRVLVVGGRGTDATKELASTELWNPKTRRFAAGPPLSVGRSGHTATRLPDGRVLVVGGATRVDSDAGVHLEALRSTELFDPRTNRWSPGPPLLEPRNWHTATLLPHGEVLVVGGAREQKTHLASVELFSSDGGFTARAPLPRARCLHEAALGPQGEVAVVGGRSNVSQSPLADAGLSGLQPPAARTGEGFGVPVAWASVYRPEADAWSELPETADARQRHQVLWLDAGVTVVGGATTHGATNLVERYQGGPEWATPERSLPFGLAGLTATSLGGGAVLVAGGEPPNQVDSAAVMRFEPVEERWCKAGELKASRKLHSATALPDGTVLIIGGLSAGIPEGDAELWSPRSGACEEPSAPALEW